METQAPPALKLAFIGAGRMASALVKGILATGLARPGDICCTGAADGTAEQLARDTGIGCSYDPQTLLQRVDWVVLACKPQQLAELSAEMCAATAGAAILSILAGTPLSSLQQRFPHASAWIRCMPNTPGQIGAGITAYASALPLDAQQAQQVQRILAALGEVHALPESALNAVTGLSGSGPAYVFELIAGLRDGGISVGLAPDIAYRLALKTVAGAAALLEAVPVSPEQHRDWVCSPGGTTLAGLAVLENASFRSMLQATVAAATRRAEELAAGPKR